MIDLWIYEEREGQREARKEVRVRERQGKERGTERERRKEGRKRAGKMVQWVKSHASKPVNLSPITHPMERENQLSRVAL